MAIDRRRLTPTDSLITTRGHAWRIMLEEVPDGRGIGYAWTIARGHPKPPHVWQRIVGRFASRDAAIAHIHDADLFEIDSQPGPWDAEPTPPHRPARPVELEHGDAIVGVYRDGLLVTCPTLTVEDSRPDADDMWRVRAWDWLGRLRVLRVDRSDRFAIGLV